MYRIESVNYEAFQSLYCKFFFIFSIRLDSRMHAANIARLEVWRRILAGARLHESIPYSEHHQTTHSIKNDQQKCGKLKIDKKNFGEALCLESLKESSLPCS